MYPSDTTDSKCYQDQDNFGVVPDFSSVATHFYDVHDSSEDNQFYYDNFDHKKEPIDSTLKHTNDEDFSMDWYFSALEEILSSMDDIEADNNDSINSSIHALFGNETMSVLEQELFFENEMTSSDIENHEDVSDDLTENIFSTNGTDNKECAEVNNHKEDDVIDLTETVVHSECTAVNNNDLSPRENDVIDLTETVVHLECTEVKNNDLSPKDEINAVSETPPDRCETMLAEKFHQPNETGSPNGVFLFNDFNSSFESQRELCETTPFETNLHPEETILDENYLFELKCTLCNKTFSINECMSHICDERIKTTETFSCKKCDRTFSDKAELKTHEKTHFTCSICGRNLASQFSLERHCRLVHGKTNVKFK